MLARRRGEGCSRRAICVQTSDQLREETLASHAEPSRACGLGNRTHHLGHAMLQIVGDAEKERIAESGIIHMCERRQCHPVAKFETAAIENIRAKIEAKPHLASPVLGVGVPRKLMLRTGRQTVDSADKLADLRAAGNGTDNVQKFRAVQKKEKEVDGHWIVWREFRTEFAMRRTVPRRLLHLPLNLRQQHGFEEPFQHHTMICGEAIAQGVKVSEKNQAFPGELQHGRWHLQKNDIWKT